MLIEKVMIVDDDAHIRRITEISLRKLTKWTIVEAESGEHAAEKAVREKPDLILLDVMMPGKDGPAVLADLRVINETSEIPVIFMTAKIQAQEIEEYMKLGACGVIGKPFDPMTLPEQIQSILDCSSSTEGNTEPALRFR